jgi:hypothetical protein
MPSLVESWCGITIHRLDYDTRRDQIPDGRHQQQPWGQHQQELLQVGTMTFRHVVKVLLHTKFDRGRSQVIRLKRIYNF